MGVASLGCHVSCTIFLLFCLHGSCGAWLACRKLGAAGPAQSTSGSLKLCVKCASHFMTADTAFFALCVPWKFQWNSSSFYPFLSSTVGIPRWRHGKESVANAGDAGDSGLIPGLGRFPLGRKWQPTPVFLPGKSQEYMSLAGYSPWSSKEFNITERLATHHPL